MTSIRIRAALAALATALASPAWAQTPIVDQAHDTAGGGALGAALNECCAQTFQIFTAGVTGTLVGVNAEIWGGSGTSQLRLSIQGIANGLPDGQVLASTTLATTGTLLDDYVSLDPGARITAGTQYALVADYVNAPPPGAGMCQGTWGGTTGDRYAAGEYLIYYPGYGWLYSGMGYDLFFRTWVIPDDADGDGFARDVDCDDSNASAFPGAVEVTGDGVDQDCNGYDLTIAVTKATFSAAAQDLRVEASSALGVSAGLSIVDVGPMSWKAKKDHWVFGAAPVANPGSVVVCGLEGCASAEVLVEP